MQTLPKEFRKEVKFNFTDSKTDINFRFYLHGPKGAVQFVFDIKEYYGKLKVIPYDLGYHSPVPRYEGHTAIGVDCHVLNGKCYYDGSSLNADSLWQKFVETNDSDIIWTELLDYYNHVFDSPESESATESNPAKIA